MAPNKSYTVFSLSTLRSTSFTHNTEGAPRVRTQICNTFFIGCTGLFVQFILFGQSWRRKNAPLFMAVAVAAECVWAQAQAQAQAHKTSNIFVIRTWHTIVKLNWIDAMNEIDQCDDQSIFYYSICSRFFRSLSKENWIMFEPDRYINWFLLCGIHALNVFKVLSIYQGGQSSQSFRKASFPLHGIIHTKPNVISLELIEQENNEHLIDTLVKRMNSPFYVWTASPCRWWAFAINSGCFNTVL